MPLLKDQELAQFFTNKTKEWEDKEERPLRASLTVSVPILMVGYSRVLTGVLAPRL